MSLGRLPGRYIDTCRGIGVNVRDRALRQFDDARVTSPICPDKLTIAELVGTSHPLSPAALFAENGNISAWARSE
jgi:hypothetical protein